jgi:hypothetical protein
VSVIWKRGERKELPPPPPNVELTLSDLLAESERLIQEARKERKLIIAAFGLSWSE